MIKVSLVGCGRISARHSDLLGNNQIKNASLVAVCDITKSKADLVADKYNIPSFTNMHKMMQDVNVDVVVVLTESGNHARHVIELSQYGKHIVVEKPMALTIDDADEMILACQKNKCKLFVVKQNRFNIPDLLRYFY